MDRVIAQTLDRAFQTRGRAFGFLVIPQLLDRMFQRARPHVLKQMLGEVF